MASFTLRPTERFPAGTSVSVYLARYFQTDTPTATPVTTATTGSDGTTAFTGLSYSTDYVAAVLNGSWKKVQFRTDADPASLSATGQDIALLTAALALKADQTDLAATNTNISVIKEAPLNLQQPEFGAIGNADNIDTSLSAALTALGANGGTILIPNGDYRISSPPSLKETRNVVLRGLGANNAGAQAATRIIYTGTSTRAIDARSSYGFELRDLQLIYNNTGFTGLLIDFDHSIAQDASAGLIDGCYLGGTGSAVNAAALVGLNNAISSTIRNCHMDRAVIGVRGRATGADYSNAIGIEDVVFTNMGTASISAAGQGWKADHCTFQQLSNGNAGAYAHGGVSAGGMDFTTCWFGDANTSGTWIDWKGSGLDARGNYFASGATAVALGASSFGCVINANVFDSLTTAVAIAANCKALDLHANDYQTVTNKYTLGASRPIASRLPGPTGDVVATDAATSRAYRTTNQAVPTGVTTYVSFDAERFDTDAIHDNSTNPTRLTCRTPGVYLVGANVRWASSASGTYRYAELRINGSTRIAAIHGAVHNVAKGMSIVSAYQMAAGDYVELGVGHDVGADLDVRSDSGNSTEFWMAQIA